MKAVSLVAVVSMVAAAQSVYRETLIDLNAQHIPTALSHSAQVSGVRWPHDGFVWNGVTLSPASTFSAYSELVIEDINRNNKYVGYQTSLPQWSGIGHFSLGAQVQLPPFPGCGSGFRLPLALSDNDVVAGFAVCPGTRPRAMVFKSSAYLSLGLTGPDSTAEDISASGRYVVGWQGTLNNFYSPPPLDFTSGSPTKYPYGSNDATTAYRFDLDLQQLQPLTSSIVGLPAGAQVRSTTALGVNNDGAAVGYVTYALNGVNHERPVLWPNPQAAWVLPMPTQSSHGCRATSINSQWQVVATCYRYPMPQQTAEAFVWDATFGSRLLKPLTQNPSTSAGYVSATDINDLGQITVAVPTALSSNPGVALLSPTQLPYGACFIGAQCQMLFSNQCTGLGGTFPNPPQLCALPPDLGLE